MHKTSNSFFAAFKEFWPFLLPILILLPGLADFPFPGSGAGYSDLAVTHFPNAVLLKTAVLEDKTLPLWAPHILGGFPFVAHPYSGIWYLPYWLSLLFPLPLGLNLLTGLHLIWSGIGMYLLMRQRGLGRNAAVIGGLAFEAAPKVFAHIGAGHLMLVIAVCWTPWLLWSVRRTLTPSRLSRLVQPGVILAIIFLIDPRWAIYAGAVWLAWQLTFDTGSLLQRGRTIVIQILIAIALALPAAWLYLQYALLSTRSMLSPVDVLQFSIPIGFLPFLLIAQRLPSHEFTLYIGLVVAVLAFVGSPWRKATRLNIFWTVVFIAALLVSLGSNIPGMNLLANVPGFDQLRVPPRVLFLASMALAALAAGGAQRILDGERPLARKSFLILLLVVASSSIAFWVSNFDLWKLSFWATLILALPFIATELYAARKISPRFFTLLLSGLLLLDLVAFDATLVRFRHRAEVINEDADVARFLAQEPGRFRVYSPSYSLSQQTAALFGIELASGVDPLQLASYARFMESASGFSQFGYSVSQPPIYGDPPSSNTEYIPDSQLLGFLNVKFVLTEFRIDAEGLREVEFLGSTYIYENEFIRPRAWVENETVAYSEVELLEWSHNNISIRAIGPGLLVLSEIAFPGWRVRIDGKPATMQTSYGVLRSVQIDTGEHQVEFRFVPGALLVGIPVSFLSSIALVVWPGKAKENK